MRRVCVFTATRAEWGLLRGVAEGIRQSAVLELRLLVSGTHLSERHGMTIGEVEAEGFAVDDRVDILKFDDSPEGVCRAMGLALDGYGQALARMAPDLLLVLGDRYETFCAAAAAQILRIPVVHIHGGETTEGAVDEAFRHAITKMSHLHFPCAEVYRHRIIQLGESPERVFNVGALGVENIRNTTLMNREELSASIGFGLDGPFFLVTFHPVTLENATAGRQFGEVLAALEQFADHKVLFTKANADTGGERINAMIDTHVQTNQNRCFAVASLGFRRYLSAMNACDALVGNSSSGILEAPALGVPAVNIGDRQKGRMRTQSTVDCTPERDAIVSAIRRVLEASFQQKVRHQTHPCDRLGTAGVIVRTLETFCLDGILKKTFIDMEAR